MKDEPDSKPVPLHIHKWTKFTDVKVVTKGGPPEAVRIGIQRGDEPVEVIECELRWKEAPPGSGQLVPELVLAP